MVRQFRFLAIFALLVSLNANLNCQDLIAMFNEGVRLYKEGKVDEALALFRKVVEINPKDGEAWIYIGTILLTKNDHEGAISAFEKGLSQPLPKLIAALGWVNLGIAYQLGQKDLAKAIEAYEKAIAFKPDLPEAHYNLILAHLVQKNYAEAIKAGERAFATLGRQLKPEQVQATFEKALEFLQRDYDKAMEILRSMAQQQLPRPEFYALMGQAYEGLKQYSRAALFYGQASALAPQVSRYLSDFGNALCQIKRWSEALKVLERATSIDNLDPIAFTLLGIAYGELGRWQDAITVFRRAVELAPQNFETRIALASAYEQIGQTSQAMQEYLTALGIREDPIVLSRLAWLYILQGEKNEQTNRLSDAEESYLQAIQRLKRAMNLNPKISSVQINLAIAQRKYAALMFRQGQTKIAEENFQEAEKVLQDYIAQNPKDSNAKLELARLLSDRKRYDDALRIVREVISAEPKIEEAYILLGFIALQLVRLDDAEQAYIQALKLNPKSADALVGLGAVAFYKNRLDEAEAWFKRALEINPNHHHARQNLEIVKQAKERSK
ncbi:MAG: tetratricopeptide repeat protein [Armatimonadetes bacterium]|nr:tetratricopeptide repeat protein [Armatimonadota bacterium]MDW8027088.1 tetratricopeptide repeat protein [Armatimonadota bacterium]